MGAFWIGVCLGKLIVLFLRLVMMALVFTVRGTWWLLNTLLEIGGSVSQTAPVSRYVLTPRGTGRVVGEDALGCVIGEDWSEDDPGRDGPVAPDPGPPHHGIQQPVGRIIDARAQRMPAWNEVQNGTKVPHGN